jgi:predicted nucleotidyltransferase
LLNAEKSILKTLAYFNIFNYPLRKDELFSFVDARYDRALLEEALYALCDAEVIHTIGEFYSLQKNIFLADRRRKGNERAIEKLKTARKIARLLYRFPFVRGVAVSGSLSKNYADKDSDIDFFIITKENRLWLARTLMHLFKKLSFILGKEHWLCMNYYIDESALEIKEKNVFTAMEVITLLPMYGNRTFKDFFIANKWAKSYFPVFYPKVNSADDISKGAIQSLVEAIFNNRFGHFLDRLLMKGTLKRWKKKTETHQRSYSGELMALDGNVHYAKPDPSNFQQKILLRIERETEAMMLRWESVNSA